MAENKPRIVFLGSRPLGRKVLEFLLEQPDIEVAGMLVQTPGPDRYWTEDPADLDVRIFSDEAEMMAEPFDLGISVNYWRIIREPLLSFPALGFVNVHHAYNLRIRGRNCTTHALLRARPDNIWHHGSTLHYISEQLDAGQIIASRACEIREDDTALSLFERAEEASFAMLREWLPRLWRERIIAYDPPDEFHEWKKRDINEREVDLTMDALAIYDRVRAFVFPPFELPYAHINGRKKNLTTLASDADSLLIDAGEGRRVYLAP